MNREDLIMNKKVRIAYEWALSQSHRSVAATYSKILAEHVRELHGAHEMILELEADYPNWHKFRDIVEAVRFHAKSQDIVIKRVRENIDRLIDENKKMMEAMEWYEKKVREASDPSSMLDASMSTPERIRAQRILLSDAGHRARVALGKEERP